MERLLRKLTLLNVPVFEIDRESEILSVILGLINERGSGSELERGTSGGAALSNNRYNKENFPEFYEVQLGVEESGIFIVERKDYNFIRNCSDQYFSALLIKEVCIVESIEVALFKINSGSNFYGKILEVIQPENLPKNCLIFILKNK